ncbi:replication-relaxation family protein [Streptomyces sp. AC555_RSS877]|uniref:replication-relaxation family protein n=1 Tax=Streptomyces sp. AC555_RSS877 TaxID=2823688 RepID=UPI001C275AAF|nr:replication-relaxation family protein [Streptomyces sp. AC555_RSS877]
MRPPRFTAARLEGERRRLSERDHTVLASLDKVRILTLRQLQRLHVADGSPAARTRRAQLLLTRLHKRGLVVRFARTIGGVRAGSSGYVYGLTGLGQAVIETDGPHRRRHIWEAKPYFQDHLLAVAELYVHTVEEHGRGAAELIGFDAEPVCWRHFTGPGGELVVLKPDAYVRLGVGDFEHSRFIEVDMGTEGMPTIQKKSQRYIDYWRSGMEQQFRGVFPKVVWLVKDTARGERISQVIRKLSADAQGLFEVGLLSQATNHLKGTRGAAA